MIKRTIACSLAMFLVATTGTALAKSSPSGRWWRVPRVVQYLDLKDAQIQQLEKAYRASRLRMIELKSRVEAEQFELQNLIEDPGMDEAAVRAQHQRLEKARSMLAEERFQFFMQVRKIVGYDRFQQLMTLKNRTGSRTGDRDRGAIPARRSQKKNW